MIEISKKYRLKKLKGWFEKDSEEFTVVCFGEHNIVGRIAPDGEKYVFATCVDKTGKRYNIELDNIRGFEDDFYKANS